MIALAVGNLLAILGLAQSVTDTSHASWRDHGEDVKISTQGRQPFDALAASLIRATPGVASAEPMFVTAIKLAGQDATSGRSASGRCSTTGSSGPLVHADRRAGRGPCGRRRARYRPRHRHPPWGPGPVETASGPLDLRVIGISSNQQENGTALFVPLTTMHAPCQAARRRE